MVPDVGRKDVDEDAGGKATPKTEPEEGYIGSAGVLAVS